MLLGRQTSNFNPCMVALGSFLPGSRGPVKHRALVQFIRNAEVRQRPIGTSDAVKLDLVLLSSASPFPLSAGQHCRQAAAASKERLNTSNSPWDWLGRSATAQSPTLSGTRTPHCYILDSVHRSEHNLEGQDGMLYCLAISDQASVSLGLPAVASLPRKLKQGAQNT